MVRVGSLYANRMFVCFCVGVASGPVVRLAGCGGALDPPVVYSTNPPKAVAPVLVLLFGVL